MITYCNTYYQIFYHLDSVSLTMQESSTVSLDFDFTFLWVKTILAIFKTDKFQSSASNLLDVNSTYVNKGFMKDKSKSTIGSSVQGSA